MQPPSPNFCRSECAGCASVSIWASAAHRGAFSSSNAAMIARLTTLDPIQIKPLMEASQREGFRFLTRLCEEWASGTNRFEQPGEALFGVSDGGGLLGVGGINHQNESTGRLRRFYILPSHRRRGLGHRLLHHILSHAAEHFRWVVLRTDTDAADRFYRACGFTRIQDSGHATHRIELVRAEPGAPSYGDPAPAPEASDTVEGRHR